MRVWFCSRELSFIHLESISIYHMLKTSETLDAGLFKFVW